MPFRSLALLVALGWLWAAWLAVADRPESATSGSTAARCTAQDRSFAAMGECSVFISVARVELKLLTAGRGFPLLAAEEQPALGSFADKLHLGAIRLMRAFRRSLRVAVKWTAWSLKKWIGWIRQALLFGLLGLLAPLLDRSLVKTWRESGLNGLKAYIFLALAVYIRLLLDSRAPVLGKGILLVAIAYGIAPRDLVADRVLPFGLFDDVIAIVAAARCFMRLCPDSLVGEHARRVSRWRRIPS